MNADTPKGLLRQLSLEDIPAIEDLLKHQARLFQMQKKEGMNKQYIDSLKHRLANDTEHTSLRIYGVFFDHTLVAVAGGFFGIKMPLWTLAYMHSRKEGHLNYRETTGRIIDKLIELAESKNIYRFDYATGLRSILTYDPHNFPSRLIKLSDKAKRYRFYTDAVIPKNTKPQYEYHWFLMSQQTHEIDMIIRVGELKDEYKTEIIKRIAQSEKNKSQRSIEL